MASQKQIEANRKNGKKTTGTRTPEGRLASSHNAVRHGLSAEQVVIEGENEANFNELLQASVVHRDSMRSNTLLSLSRYETRVGQSVAAARSCFAKRTQFSFRSGFGRALRYPHYRTESA